MNQTLRYGTSFQKLRARYASAITIACLLLAARSGRTGLSIDGADRAGPGRRRRLLEAPLTGDGATKTSGTPPSTATNDRVDRFVGQPKTPAPGVCPSLP